MCICAQVSVCTHTLTHTYTYIPTYTHTRARAHTHTHTHRSSRGVKRGGFRVSGPLSQTWRLYARAHTHTRPACGPQERQARHGSRGGGVVASLVYFGARVRKSERPELVPCPKIRVQSRAILTHTHTQCVCMYDMHAKDVLGAISF
jgi:hypothetical protein